MTCLLIIFILTAGHWEFSNIEPINDLVDARGYCEQLAAAARDSHTRAICTKDEGSEA